jgi:hypothetical protein
MRLRKTLLVGVGLYAMRALLNRSRAKHRSVAAPDADFADTEPASRSLRESEETVLRQPEEKRFTFWKP